MFVCTCDLSYRFVSSTTIMEAVPIVPQEYVIIVLVRIQKLHGIYVISLFQFVKEFMQMVYDDSGPEMAIRLAEKCTNRKEIIVLVAQIQIADHEENKKVNLSEQKLIEVDEISEKQKYDEFDFTIFNFWGENWRQFTSDYYYCLRSECIMFSRLRVLSIWLVGNNISIERHSISESITDMRSDVGYETTHYAVGRWRPLRIRIKFLMFLISLLKLTVLFIFDRNT